MFARNQWYVIGWARDIGAEAYARTVCGEPILAYRTADGAVTAMRDACPHRLLPLSMGIREGDAIRCRYHGLLIDAGGRATEMPIRTDHVPAGLCVQLYPVIERYGFVWVWIGAADKADPALLPDFWMCEAPGWIFDGDVYHVRCDYRLLIDNLMDLTHETYVHANSIGQRELMQVPVNARSADGQVVVERWMPDVSPPPAFRANGNGAGNVDRWQICRFLPPSSVVIDVGVAPTGTGATLADHPVRSFVIDAMTPETETTTHYYWGAARKADDPTGADTARLKAVQAKVFAEDVEVLEAQQRSIERNGDLKLRGFNIDAGGVRARAILRRMVEGADFAENR